MAINNVIFVSCDAAAQGLSKIIQRKIIKNLQNAKEKEKERGEKGKRKPMLRTTKLQVPDDNIKSNNRKAGNKTKMLKNAMGQYVFCLYAAGTWKFTAPSIPLCPRPTTKCQPRRLAFPVAVAVSALAVVVTVPLIFSDAEHKQEPKSVRYRLNRDANEAHYWNVHVRLRGVLRYPDRDQVLCALHQRLSPSSDADDDLESGLQSRVSLQHCEIVQLVRQHDRPSDSEIPVLGHGHDALVNPH